MTILVTGATGNVGRHVVAGLHSEGAHVRALTRDPATAGLPAGVDVVAGSPRDADALAGQLDGVSTVFLMMPGFDVDGVRATVRVLAGTTRRVVFLSSGSVADGVPPGEQVGPIARAHAAVEEEILDSGLEWTFLRPHGFATNLLRWSPRIRASEPVPLVLPHAPTTAIDERDLAAVAVRALPDDGHTGVRHELTGGELLTPADQLRIVGEVTGRTLGWAEQPVEEWVRSVLGAGVSESEVTAMSRSFEQAAGGRTDTVERVTGRAAHTFRDWVAAHAGELVGPTPPFGLDDGHDPGYVLVATWRVADPARQREVADAALDDWQDRHLPEGLRSHSVLLSTDGQTILHYSQWTDEAAVEAFRRAGRDARNADIDGRVPGIERVGATGYRRYRSAVPETTFEPGVLVLVSFGADSTATAESFVDALLDLHPVVTGGPVPEGMAANHFHVGVGDSAGSAVLNVAEFASVEAHQRVAESRLRDGDEVPTLIANTPGLTPHGFARYLPHGTVYGVGRADPRY